MSLIIEIIRQPVDRDRNNPMGLGPNTYAAATITSRQELAGYSGPNYHIKFSLHTYEIYSYTDFI